MNSQKILIREWHGVRSWAKGTCFLPVSQCRCDFVLKPALLEVASCLCSRCPGLLFSDRGRVHSSLVAQFSWGLGSTSYKFNLKSLFIPPNGSRMNQLNLFLFKSISRCFSLQITIWPKQGKRMYFIWYWHFGIHRGFLCCLVHGQFLWKFQVCSKRIYILSPPLPTSLQLLYFPI